MIHDAPIITAEVFGATTGVLDITGGSLFFAPSQPIEWELRLNGNNLDYAPFGGAVATAFQGRPYVAGVLTYVRIKIEMPNPEPTWVSPFLVIDDFRYVGDVPTISGRCLSALLDIEDQGMDDVTSTVGNIRYSHEALIETLAAYGITRTQLNYGDFPIDNLHRIGNPLQIVAGLTEPFAYWEFQDGDQMVFNAVQPSGSATIDDVVDFSDIKDIDYRRSSWGIYNQVTLERVTPSTDGCVLDEEKAGDNIGGTLGTQTAPPPQIYTLSSPVVHATVEWDAYRGELVQWFWLDDQDSFIYPDSRQTFYGGPTRVAHKVQFSYDIPTSQLLSGEFTPAYRVKINGKAYNPDPVFDLEPEDFVRTKDDAATQEGGLFVRPAPEPAITQVLLREQDAELAATLELDENVILGQNLSFTMRLDPNRFQSGRWIGLTDKRLGADQYPFRVATMRYTFDTGTPGQVGDTGTMHVEGVAKLE